MLGALPLEDVSMKFDTCAVVGNSGSVSGRVRHSRVSDWLHGTAY